MGFDIKRMDIYRKVPKDLTQPTVTGAVISICCVLFIIFMLATELLYFVSPDVKSELLVANNDPTEKIPVRINVSIPRMKCEFLGIDIQVHEIYFQSRPAQGSWLVVLYKKIHKKGRVHNAHAQQEYIYGQKS
jgi:hypothetical protein